MWIIFVPGAIVAALIMFRWARTLACYLIIAAMVYFYAITQGWAQDRSAPPRWVVVTQDRIHTDYVDMANIVRTGDIDHGEGSATIWVVQDFHNFYEGKPVPLVLHGKSALSIRYQVEIQCIGGPNQPAKGLFYAYYSGHMGSGSIVDGGPMVTSGDVKAGEQVASFACLPIQFPLNFLK
jgi:hypothetical protein